MANVLTVLRIICAQFLFCSLVISAPVFDDKFLEKNECSFPPASLYVGREHGLEKCKFKANNTDLRKKEEELLGLDLCAVFWKSLNNDTCHSTLYHESDITNTSFIPQYCDKTLQKVLNKTEDKCKSLCMKDRFAKELCTLIHFATNITMRIKGESLPKTKTGTTAITPPQSLNGKDDVTGSVVTGQSTKSPINGQTEQPTSTESHSNEGSATPKNSTPTNKEQKENTSKAVSSLVSPTPNPKAKNNGTVLVVTGQNTKSPINGQTEKPTSTESHSNEGSATPKNSTPTNKEQKENTSKAVSSLVSPTPNPKAKNNGTVLVVTGQNTKSPINGQKEQPISTESHSNEGSATPKDSTPTNKEQKENTPKAVSSLVSPTPNPKAKSEQSKSIAAIATRPSNVTMRENATRPSNVTKKGFKTTLNPPIPTESQNRDSLGHNDLQNEESRNNLRTEYKDPNPEPESEGHFMAYFLTAVVLCVAGYVIFHNKQKIVAFIIEGRTGRRSSRRSNKGGYSKLKPSVDDVMPSLEKSTSSTTYVY